MSKADLEPDDVLANPSEILPSPFEGVGTDIVSQVAIAALTGTPPVGVALAAIAPLLERGVQNAAREVKAFKERRGTATLLTAAHAAGGRQEEMLSRIESDRSIAGLVDEALSAGQNSTYPSRIRALGAALAAGVLADDTDRVDVEQMVIETLGRIERPHVRILLFMTQFEEGDEGEDCVPTDPHSWSYAMLFNELESLRPVLTRLLADLTAAGILNQSTESDQINGRTYNAPNLQEAWRINDFGIECLRRLRLAGLGDDPIIQYK